MKRTAREIYRQCRAHPRDLSLGCAFRACRRQFQMKMTTLTFLTAAISLLTPLAVARAQTAGTSAVNDLAIAQGGASAATIVVSAQAGKWEKQAAEDLQKYIERMSGAKVALANQPESIAAALKAATPVLIVGQEALKADASLATALASVAKKQPTVRADAVVVRRAGNRVFIRSEERRVGKECA